MHIVYRLYNLLCTLHLILSILLLMTGFNGSFTFLIIENNSIDHTHSIFSNEHVQHELSTAPQAISTSNNSTANNGYYYYSYMVFVEKNSLSGVYFIACISAALYSVIYLSLAQPTLNHVQEDNLRVLATPYDTDSGTGNHEDTLLQAVVEPQSAANTMNILLISEIFFWSFMISYSYVALATNTLELGSIELFYLRWVVHLFCVYTIVCSPNPKKRRVDISSSMAFVAFIAETFIVISVAQTQRNIVVAYFHRFLDLLLLLGHRWDASPTWEVILNCRLMYVAMGGALLHVDILFSTWYSAESHTQTG